MRNHRRLLVWDAAVSLARVVCTATERLAAGERFGVTQQMRDAPFSVISNIAEGAARSSEREFVRFLDIAAGSVGEIMGQAEGVVEVGLASREVFGPVLDQVEETKRMLHGLMQSVRRTGG